MAKKTTRKGKGNTVRKASARTKKTATKKLAESTKAKAVTHAVKSGTEIVKVNNPNHANVVTTTTTTAAPKDKKRFLVGWFVRSRASGERYISADKVVDVMPDGGKKERIGTYVPSISYKVIKSIDPVDVKGADGSVKRIFLMELSNGVKYYLHAASDNYKAYMQRLVNQKAAGAPVRVADDPFGAHLGFTPI